MSLPARKISGKKSGVHRVIKEAQKWVVSDKGNKTIVALNKRAQQAASDMRKAHRSAENEDVNHCVIDL